VRFFVLFIVFFFNTYSILRAEDIFLSTQELSGMSYTRLQKIHIAYSEFFMRYEHDLEQGKNPEPKKTTYFKNFWNDLLIANAYGLAPDGTLCFFGGWPSTVKSSFCRKPWTTTSDTRVQNLGAYSNFCGDNNLFRCNPTLFGKGQDGNGICINTGGSYSNLTERCERETRALRPQVIEEWQKDPSKISQLSSEIKKFCQSYERYDACDDLAQVIKDITGSEIGQFSGEGPKRDPRQASLVQNRNVEAEGEKLSPIAQKNEEEGLGKHILQRCADLLKGDAKKLFSSTPVSCVNEAVKQNLGDLQNIAKVAESINLTDSVRKINAKALEQNVLAYMLNEIRFSIPMLDVRDKQKLFNDFMTKYPHLKNNSLYEQAFYKAYKDLDKEARAGRLYPVDLESTRTQFNNLASSVNRACANVRAAYKKEFGEAGYLERYITSRSEHKAFFKKHNATIMKELTTLMDKSMIGHLMATNTFKNSVVDPGEDYIESCARSDAFQVVKSPISSSNIRAGHNEVKNMMAANMAKLNQRELDLKSGDPEKTRSHLKNFLKNDGSLLMVTLQSLPPEGQKALGYGMCHETQKILQQDALFRIGDSVAGVAGMAGAVITMTGIGAPVGAALMGASALWGGGRAVQAGTQASRSQQAADYALAIRRDDLKEYFDRSQEAGAQKRQALISGGLAALSGFPAIKVLTATKAITTTTTQTAAVVAVQNASSRSVAVVNTAQQTAQRAVPVASRTAQTATSAKGAVGVLDDAIRAKPFNLLTADQKSLIIKEASNVMTTAGIKRRPSSLIKRKDIEKLDLESARKLLKDISGVSDVKSAWRSAVGKLHPDKHGSQPQAIKDVMNHEVTIINELKSRIFKLNNNQW
jgi:hypothetical protein